MLYYETDFNNFILLWHILKYLLISYAGLYPISLCFNMYIHQKYNLIKARLIDYMRNTIVLYFFTHSSGLYADFYIFYIDRVSLLNICIYIEFDYDILKLYWNKLLEGGKGLDMFHFNFTLVSPCEEISWFLKEKSWGSGGRKKLLLNTSVLFLT